MTGASGRMPQCLLDQRQSLWASYSSPKEYSIEDRRLQWGTGSLSNMLYGRSDFRSRSHGGEPCLQYGKQLKQLARFELPLTCPDC